MRLILGLDALRPPLTGIGHYTRQLALALFESGEIESMEGLATGRLIQQARLQELLNPSSIEAPSGARHEPAPSINKQLAARLRDFPGVYRGRAWLGQWRCRATLRGFESVLYHEPRSMDVCRTASPTIVTVHDLSHIRYPQHHPEQRVAHLKRQLPQTLQHTRHIIVDATVTQHELMEIFSVEDNKISVIPLGVDQEFFAVRPEGESPTLGAFQLLPGQYLLSVGTLEPRKNIERTLQAYAALPEQLRKDFPLVLVGGKGWKDAAILARSKQIKQPGRVVLTGYVTQSQLHDLYAGAAAFLYPSLYEGFGLPILEAMASGVPVITSNVSSMPEVAGDAALLVDPTSVDDIADAMQRIVEDRALAATLIARGSQRAREYTWTRTAEQTLNVYRHVLAGR